MINNSAMSSQMNVADLAPKAATKQLPERRGDSAFGEALAGAHTVHDRRESQAAGNARRDWAQGDRSTERTRGQDRASEVRSDKADRAGRSEDTGTGTVGATETDSATDTTDPTAFADDTSATTTTQTDQSDDATTVTSETGTGTPTTTAAAQATVAVAAAPVITDLDAIIVPTSTTITQVATDAIDAAIKLAIDTDAAAATTTDAAATTTVAATTTTAVAASTDTDVDAQLAAAANAQGAEDAETGDVQAGPTRPTTSTPATTSGPSPVQLAAATFNADPTAAAVVTTTDTAEVAQVATSDAVGIAAGTTKDAAATQLVQAAAVEIDSDALPEEAVVADDAVALKAKSEGAATQLATGNDAELAVEAEEPDVVQAARLNQTQAPTVAVNAQVQAKAAEQAAEEGADDAAPVKLEPLPAQAAPIATAARGEGVGNAMRMREGLQAQVQERIDHIAEQLATRLRLSQAAGGSQVQLSLKPRELGEVTVQMNVREGSVAATILVDKADTLRTLQTNIEDLKRSLEAQGLQIGEFSVDVRGDSGAGGANARAAADLNQGDRRSSNGSNATSLAGAAAATPGLSGDRTVSAEEAHDGDVSVLA